MAQDEGDPGDGYDTDYHWYNEIGDYWKPVVKKCTVQAGIDAYVVYIETYEGTYISCAYGNGNCFRRTSCRL